MAAYEEDCYYCCTCIKENYGEKYLRELLLFKGVGVAVVVRRMRLAFEEIKIDQVIWLTQLVN